MVLDWIKAKLQQLNAHETYCSLVLDEVQISKALQYDPSLNQFVGFVSKEFDSGKTEEMASLVLCFMAKGITLHWKQVIGTVHV